MWTSRVAVELPRPVPLTPLGVTAAVVRAGRSTRTCVVSLSSEGREVAAARLTQILAVDDVGLPPIDGLEGDRSPLPRFTGEATGLGLWDTGAVAFHSHGSEHGVLDPEPEALGPSRRWIRVPVDLLPGVGLSPAARAVAAADFSNGVSRVLENPGWLFINPDLTVHLLRPPSGEWIGLDAVSFVDPAGVGMSDATLFDASGRVGRANQSLLVRPRGPRP